MKTADERLRFALEFSQMDLDVLREGDWLNLRDDLRAFVWLGAGEHTRDDLAGVVTVPLAKPLPQDMTEPDFRALQREAWSFFGGVVTIQGPLQVCYLQEGSRGVLHFMGSAPDMFLIRLAYLLDQQTTDRILKCPECEKRFLKIRKQKYCSRACVNRANKRSWRERKQVQDKKPQSKSRRAKKTKQA